VRITGSVEPPVESKRIKPLVRHSLAALVPVLVLDDVAGHPSRGWVEESVGLALALDRLEFGLDDLDDELALPSRHVDRQISPGTCIWRPSASRTGQREAVPLKKTQEIRAKRALRVR
jgi:hypothetical protein